MFVKQAISSSWLNIALSYVKVYMQKPGSNSFKVDGFFQVRYRTLKGIVKLLWLPLLSMLSLALCKKKKLSLLFPAPIAMEI